MRYCASEKTFLDCAARRLLPRHQPSPHRSWRKSPSKARVGILIGAGSDASDYALEAFRLGLRDQGFTEDRNLVIERQVDREGREELLARAAKALAEKAPDVVLAANTPPVKAMRLAAPDVPIVMVAIGDPVGSGLVASLVRPGGRITGLSGLDAELTGKRLELLKEVAPGTTKVGLLASPDNPVFAVQLRNAEAAAKAKGVELLREDVHRTSELDDAVAAIVKRGGTALLRLDGFRSADALQKLGALTTRYRLPFCGDRLLEVRGGLLMSYGPNVAAEFRQAAGHRRQDPARRRSRDAAGRIAAALRARAQRGDGEEARPRLPGRGPRPRECGDRLLGKPGP